MAVLVQRFFDHVVPKSHHSGDLVEQATKSSGSRALAMASCRDRSTTLGDESAVEWLVRFMLVG